MWPPRAINTTAPGIELRSTSWRNVAERRSRRLPDSPTSFGRWALGNPRVLMLVREGRFGDLGLLELGHDLPAKPLELLEANRFRDANREAHRHVVETRIASFETLQMLD